MEPAGKAASRAETTGNRYHFSTRLGAYFLAIVLAAAGCLLYLAWARPFAQPSRIGLAAVFTFFVMLAGVYPIHFAPNTKVHMGAAAKIATVLLFGPLAAVLIVAIGVALSQVLLFLKKDWLNIVFNTSEAVLHTTFASLTYFAVNQGVLPAHLITLQSLLAVLAAATVMYLTNSSIVATAVGLQARRNPLQLWWLGTKQSAIQELALMAMGLLCVLCVQETPWSLPFLVLPVLVIYHSFKRLVVLNQQVEAQMTELKAMQAQLVESARMASVGTMVAGIAHQINNPIFVIRGRTEMLLEDAEQHLRSDMARQYLRIIFGMADRISHIVNSLLPSSQTAADGSLCADLTDVLGNVSALLEPKVLRANVRLRKEFAAELPLVAGDAAELQELFINLVDNACNAMPQGGQITIRTAARDGCVVAQVQDTGSGIAPENLSRIFDPFFTTRKGRGGIGLGLYVTRHIAEKYGGNIRVESEVGRGTTFTVTLRVNAAEQAKAAELAASGSSNLPPAP